MNIMDNCLFCKIIKKEIKSNIVYEDSDFCIFMDKFPSSPGHLLIVPKKHILDALEIEDEIFLKLNSMIKKMMALVMEKLGAEGVRVGQNNGICQEIKHYHIHIVPAYSKKILLSDEEIYQKLIEK